jgi:hypothetical protein
MNGPPLFVRVPAGLAAERQYIAKVVLGDFLGLSHHLVEGDGGQVAIDDGAGNIVLTPDVFFRDAAGHWLQSSSLPPEPLQWWRTEDLPVTEVGLEKTIPVVFGTAGDDGRAYRCDGQTAWLGLDVMGSAFFLLTRYEEVVTPSRDPHGRFPATASLAFREKFLDRPLVDEYVEILWAALRALWPDLKRKPRNFKIQLSHDVDWPFLGYHCPARLAVRHAAAAVLKAKSPIMAAAILTAKLTENPERDPANTFAFIMEVSEKSGLTSEFYFIAENYGEPINGVYSLDDPAVKEIIGEILRRGHRVGIHPSYRSYRDPGCLRAEFIKLRDATRAVGHEQEAWGGRQHYLRWENPTTWQCCADAGLKYDCTLGYADRIGFRCGTCHEFQVYNLRTRTPLSLTERPLVVMDGTLFSPQYLNVDQEMGAEATIAIAQICKRFRGSFTLLWHNSMLAEPRMKMTYAKIIRCAATGASE